MKYDIVIIGGGPAGLSFARSLAESDLRVLVVERSGIADLEAPAKDGREIALTHLSRKSSPRWAPSHAFRRIP